MVVGFIQGSWVHLGRAFLVVGFISGRWFHSGAPWVSLVTFRVAVFIRVRSGCRRVHSGLLGSLDCALGVDGFIRGR